MILNKFKRRKFINFSNEVKPLLGYGISSSYV